MNGMQLFGGTIRGVHSTQCRYPRRLSQPCERRNGNRSSDTVASIISIPFQTLFYSSLFYNLEATEQASQPERTDILAYVPTVGTGFVLQRSHPSVVGHSESLSWLLDTNSAIFPRGFSLLLMLAPTGDRQANEIGGMSTVFKRRRCMISY